MLTKFTVIRFVVLFLVLTLTHSVLGKEAGNTAVYDPVTQDLPSINKSSPPAFHEVFIPVEDINLTGFILTANGPGPHPTMVLLHGLPGNEKNLDLAQSLRRAGFNVLFFHYRGSWGSEGDYSFTTIHKDALVAIKFLRDNASKYKIDVEKLSLAGHSFGGYAVLRAGSVDTNLACVIALSAANPAAIAQSKRADDSFESNIGNYIDTLFMLDNFSGKQALSELKNHQKEMDTRSYGEGLKGKQVLMLVGSEDKVTPSSLQIEVAKYYADVKGLEFESRIITGDHAYSVSRIAMQRIVVGWSLSHCK